MKKYLFALVALAVCGANPLLAQAPMMAPRGPAPGAPVMVLEPGPGCCDHVQTKTVCVPEHYMKEKKTVVYGSGCEKFCLCYFHGLFKSCGCDSGHCEKPHTRRYMLKKTETCEHDAVKCVPTEQPVCSHGHCTTGSCCATTGPAPVIVMPRTAPPMMPPAPAPSPYLMPR
jgi:hypothetical protein